MQKLLRPQTYPYASSSTGPYRGLLVRKYPCWDAQGPVRDTFMNEIVGKIKECLEQWLPESNSFVGFSLFMVGKVPEKTKPYIMLVSDDKARRKAAFQMVKSRSILSQYPGFELGHCAVADEFKDLKRLGRDSMLSTSYLQLIEDGGNFRDVGEEYGVEPEVLNLLSAEVCAFEYPSSTKPTRLYFHTSPRLHSHDLAYATCGGLIRINDELYALTMAHAISPTQHVNTSPKQGETHPDSSSESNDYEFTGMDDWDDDDDDADARTLTAITSPGSKTPSELSDSEESMLSVLKRYDSQPSSDISIQTHITTVPSVIYEDNGVNDFSECEDEPLRECEAFGSVVAIDMEMDIAVIKVNAKRYRENPLLPHPYTLALSGRGIVNDDLTNMSVTVRTTHHPEIKGQRSRTPFYTRLPGTTKFLELHSVQLTTSLRPGDSGSWAYNEQGALVGYVIAGNPNSVSCLLLPAMAASQSMLSLLRKRVVVEKPLHSNVPEITPRRRIEENRLVPSPQGCLTCRKRKKKCDESKPECTNCVRGGFVCFGYPNQRGSPRVENKPAPVPLEFQFMGYASSGAYEMPLLSNYPNNPAASTPQARFTLSLSSSIDGNRSPSPNVNPTFGHALPMHSRAAPNDDDAMTVASSLPPSSIFSQRRNRGAPSTTAYSGSTSSYEYRDARESLSSTNSFASRGDFMQGQVGHLRRELVRAWEVILEKDELLQEYITRDTKNSPEASAAVNEERRRIQNRIAQRKFRERQKEHKERAKREDPNQEIAVGSYRVPNASDLDPGDEELFNLAWGGINLMHMMANEPLAFDFEDPEQKEDEIKDLKAVIHSPSRDTIPGKDTPEKAPAQPLQIASLIKTQDNSNDSVHFPSDSYTNPSLPSSEDSGSIQKQLSQSDESSSRTPFISQSSQAGNQQTPGSSDSSLLKEIEDLQFNLKLTHSAMEIFRDEWLRESSVNESLEQENRELKVAIKRAIDTMQHTTLDDVGSGGLLGLIWALSNVLVKCENLSYASSTAKVKTDPEAGETQLMDVPPTPFEEQAKKQKNEWTRYVLKFLKGPNLRGRVASVGAATVTAPLGEAGTPPSLGFAAYGASIESVPELDEPDSEVDDVVTPPKDSFKSADHDRSPVMTKPYSSVEGGASPNKEQ